MALDRDMMEEHSKQGERLIYVKGSEEPYTGWVKEEPDVEDDSPFKGQALFLDRYKNGKAHGVKIIWAYGHKHGQKLAEENFKDGKKHGLQQSWHTPGTIYREEYYKNGKLHGVSTLWYVEGQKSCEAHYKDGNLHGKYTHWWHDGTKLAEIIYKNGVPYSATIRTQDGAICPFTNLKDGNGVLVEYHGRHGFQWYVTNYRNGKKHGLETEFDSEGSITSQTSWENGEKVKTIK